MKPVVANPNTTFTQLMLEFEHIDSEERTKRQIEQIIAKLQRKRRFIDVQQEEHFKYNSDGIGSNEFINMLKEDPSPTMANRLSQFKGLWKFLDELKPSTKVMLVSEHEDEWMGTERGYGKAIKPEDYLEKFSTFIKENQNKMAALNIVCSRPAELNRKSLRKLMITLDQEGFNARSLNAAWKDVKNEDIVADIISFIRTLAVGSSMISHEERIMRAVDKIRNMQEWNKVQLKWIDRFEKQLLNETILLVEDLNETPFDDAGGFDRLDKIFENRLGFVFNKLNKDLYSDVG